MPGHCPGHELQCVQQRAALQDLREVMPAFCNSVLDHFMISQYAFVHVAGEHGAHVHIYSGCLEDGEGS